ncbi:MAG TPA: hypothetical protein VE780_04275 [Thermoleophilaceae bacterium]|nr:hypothetical protein [Thermoleophilaceae bacterium]
MPAPRRARPPVRILRAAQRAVLGALMWMIAAILERRLRGAPARRPS